MSATRSSWRTKVRRTPMRIGVMSPLVDPELESGSRNIAHERPGFREAVKQPVRIVRHNGPPNAGQGARQSKGGIRRVMLALHFLAHWCRLGFAGGKNPRGPIYRLRMDRCSTGEGRYRRLFKASTWARGGSSTAGPRSRPYHRANVRSGESGSGPRIHTRALVERPQRGMVQDHHFSRPQ